MNRKKLYICIGLAALAAGASLLLFARLPEQMPVHWNARGEIDGYAGRLFGAFLMPGMMALMTALAAVLPWLSPKRFEVETFKDTYGFVMLLVVAFLGYVHGILLWAALDSSLNTAKLALAGIFLLFALLGNVMGKVRKNFWIGIRVPWTLASDQVWNETHRFAARLYFAVGAAGFVASLAGLPFPAAIALLLCGAVVPIGYSLVRYKRLEKEGRL